MRMRMETPPPYLFVVVVVERVEVHPPRVVVGVDGRQEQDAHAGAGVAWGGEAGEWQGGGGPGVAGRKKKVHFVEKMWENRRL